MVQPSGRGRAVLRVGMRLAVGLVVAGWSLLLLAWLVLHWVILPHIEQWRVPIETRASRALGVPVQLGGISVESHGWVPTIRLRDVSLLDPQGRAALVLPQVLAALSPRSLLSLELRFEQLLIDGAQLEVRRDAQGTLYVAGLPLAASGAGGNSVATSWFFRQHEVVVRGASVQWVDEQHDALPLQLSELTLRVVNTARRHQFRLDATPPAEWGERFTVQGRFRQPLLADSGDWRQWNGILYASLPDADLSQLRRHRTLPVDLRGGHGALRAWVDVRRGEAQSATVDLALQAVNLHWNDSGAQPLSLERVEGRLTARRDAEGYSAATRQFMFVTSDGLRWPAADLALAWRQRAGEPARGGSLRAERLDLKVVAQVVARLPVSAPVRQLLADTQPQGRLSGLDLRWDGPVDAPDRYQLRGLVDGLSMAAKPVPGGLGLGRPGLSQARIEFDAHERGGTARLAMARGSVDLPGVFAQPVVPMHRFDAQLAWQIDPAEGPAGSPPRIGVQIAQARFANDDAQGELTARWHTGTDAVGGHGGRFPGVLQLDGTLADAQAPQIARYLPLGVPQSTRDYLRRAIQQGTASEATIRVRGDLAHFPFDQPQRARDGEFRIVAKARDLTFAYAPGSGGGASEWPALTQLAGEVVIDRGSLAIRHGQAQMMGVQLSQIEGGIPALSGGAPTLEIHGTGRGALSDMLRFVNGSPVGALIHQSLATATASGPADIELGLTVPLLDADATRVRGAVQLGGNDLRISSELPALTAARGRVDFTERGFDIVGGTARALGGDVALSGGSQADGSLRLSAQGVATAEGLQRASELGLLSAVAESLSGRSGYRLTWGRADGQTEFAVQSDLVGMSSRLPRPFNKPAGAAWPVLYQTRPVAGAGRDAPRELLRLDVGQLLQASYQRDVSGGGLRVLRGSVAVGEGAVQAVEALATGPVAVVGAVQLPQLDVDAWTSIVTRWRQGVPSTAAADGPAGGAGAATATATADAYLPRLLEFQVDQLNWKSRQFTKLSGQLRRQQADWQASVKADQLQGEIEYRPAAGGAGAGQVVARLARLSLPQTEGEPADAQAVQAASPEGLPALDVAIDEVELGGKRLGRVEVEAVHRRLGDGATEVLEWRLQRLAVTGPQGRLAAIGSWIPAGGTAAPPRVNMTFELDVADAGGLLERLGSGRVVRGGAGTLTGGVSWIGSPMALDVPTLAGQLRLDIDAGQFLKAEPGAARLLGVLSLQSLPRRLLLDFRDVFQEGFAFDSVNGDVSISRGVASSNNLRMRGVQAVVLMEGKADIARETQNLRVVVVPEINAATASLAYAAINPAIGLGTLLAQVVLRKPLIEAGTREFHVSGSWADPRVERVDRKWGASDGAPAVTAPASAPPGQ